ncbi:AraC family transcriptional regulator [Microbulbifer hainanensis]|uniref:AraC family transcriptional regulator n=1 Tax=Microbulbifer hainanensis TaxID=2735675 RepID=UPI00186934A6|nr:AraC family transcriptional regulator [Microbulbifer hainanensis]
MKESLDALCSKGHGIDEFGHFRAVKNNNASSVNPSLFGLVWRVLETYQVDPCDLIQQSLYRPGRAEPIRSFIPADEYYGVIAGALQVIDDEAVGIRAASVLHPSHLDIFGHAWMAAPTLLAGFHMTQDCLSVLNSDLCVHLSADSNRVGLVYLRHCNSPFPGIDADCEIGGLARFCRFQFGESFTPLSVSLRRPVPKNRAIWDDYFGVSVQFDAPDNSMFVGREFAERHLPTAHTEIFERHHATLAQARAELEDSDIVARVRAEIQRQLPTGDVALEKIAEVVQFPTRTLHRKLSQQGTSFRQLLREVRIKLARQYIRDERYNVTEIAFMLGYCDAGAFTRAFREWFGDAPTAYRTRVT